jgi:hypothetical protein
VTPVQFGWLVRRMFLRNFATCATSLEIRVQGDTESMESAVKGSDKTGCSGIPAIRQWLMVREALMLIGIGLMIRISAAIVVMKRVRCMECQLEIPVQF